jgi:predicted transcriptional regulator
MKPKTVQVGIMPYEKFKKYTIAIASGRYKPKKTEPKIWFSSIETYSQVLSTKNMELLKQIEEHKPQSMTELATISGRKLSNLSRTLKTFSRYGIVRLKAKKKAKVPVVLASRFKIHHGQDLPADLLDEAS